MSKQSDSLFEQIMQLKRLGLVQQRFKTKPKKANGKLSELDIHYNNLIAESVDRSTSLERVIQIKKELTEIRRLRRGNK